jgi:hypothetical protein
LFNFTDVGGVFLASSIEIIMLMKDFDDILLLNNCFLAHCYSINNPNGDIYKRIEHSIHNSNTYQLCTCTIHLEDISFRNYFGGLGLIIRNVKNVILSSPSDAGSSILNGRLFFNEEVGILSPRMEQVNECVVKRNNYNEFRVENYIPIGFFISNDENGWKAVNQSIGSNIKSFYLATKNYNLKYYYLQQGRLLQVIFDVHQNSFTVEGEIKSKSLYK